MAEEHGLFIIEGAVPKIKPRVARLWIDHEGDLNVVINDVAVICLRKGGRFSRYVLNETQRNSAQVVVEGESNKIAEWK